MVYLLCHGGFMLSFHSPCKIRRLAAGTRTTDQQVAAELKIERGELRVVAIGEIPNPLVRRQLHRVGRAQIKGHAPEQSLMFLDVRGEQLVETFPRGGGDLAFDNLFRIAAHVVVTLVAGRQGDQDGDRIGVGHG